ncbi:unnamed protein product [Nesidiocoris tenuis]|uniref:Guanine deaminase n=1 Tax=Nesidiocoris tenuis TaxID=355587 RepID=A0A6H5GB72_9HEMI|nr:unnamed protein product [Nesidiocoris tenuis]
MSRTFIFLPTFLITDIRESDTGDVSFLNSDRYELKKLANGQFLCPGFVDLHTHAPQFPNQGLGMGLPLLDWLDKYTFPLEMRYKDENFAKKVYHDVVKSTLKSGTTTACYYGTIHRQSTTHLAKAASQLGQRALVGKVNMNRNSPANLVESTDSSLEDTESFIKDVKAFENPLVEPVITPRFAIACDTKLLRELGDLAAKYNLHVQTHISENVDEIAYTKELFPDAESYAQVYDSAGLLTDKTILGHGVHLTDDEEKLIAKRGSAVAHCPNSNTWLRSGICDVRRLWRNGVKIGLGTDVGAGSVASIIDAMRSALATSTNKSFFSADYQPLTFHEVFYLATLGGAEALGKEKVIGNFEVGKDFDALVVDVEKSQDQTPSTFTYEEHSVLERVQKLIFCGDNRNITDVYVRGRLVSTELII